ncbi:hypothetical protein FRC03_008104 [Tulasnella sp. 419]|nr:hypothetical protein FRC03_008104 [Tulasnella sp. 419]
MILAKIAWPSQGIPSEEWIPVRKQAIKLFARLWTSATEEDEMKKSTYSVEAFTSDEQLRKIANAVKWFTDHRVSMELDCISLWIDRLHEVPDGNQSTVFEEIVEAFKRAVVYGAFSDLAVEDKRLNMFVQLSRLQSRKDVQPVVTA